MGWVGHGACMRDRRGVCSILVERPVRKRIFRRPRLEWEENIKVDIQELGWAGMDWIVQAQDGDRWLVLVYVVVKFLVA